MLRVNDPFWGGIALIPAPKANVPVRMRVELGSSEVHRESSRAANDIGPFMSLCRTSS
jgi:hypothetical protein